ncbi:P-loop containing nucleoside triphosphate hydrolase protein [Halteromyces radiatus]|uniref:P-loop containing nucleoside triphosphate hydrolase protein n=1 Tax=Halteromyces radiatus TaxID=101107 RepID=UPI002221188E|nr:P-loop containing nucleoside triphosphate hydrolase protein [Halteromyces radiatus]KAI8081353.1 P-loop containing nucleoside triphosphate hydrolase protein [Halteromyces radiatus]
MEEEDDLDWANDKKKNKKKNNKLPAIPTPTEDNDNNEGRLLTKKEKEKLKKEKAKEAKRLAALEKKKKQAEEDAEFEKLMGDQASPAPAAVTNNNDDDATAATGTKSKSQLKKEKLKKKLENKAAAAPAPEPTPVEIPAAGGKGKKKGGNVAALRKMLEAQKAAEEEQRRLEEEERLRAEEEERLLAEEEARLEEARRLKKEKEKARKEQLRKEGKLLTKAQKEAQRRAQLRHQQLVESGQVKVLGLESPEPEQQKKKIVYGNKKKKGPSKEELEKKKQEEERQRKEEEERRRKEEEAKKAAAEEESSEDDWEKAALSSDEEEKPVESKEEENVKDDWEDESEEEEEQQKPVETKAPIPTKAAPAATKKSAPTKAAPTKKSAPAKVEESSDEEDESEDSDDDSEYDSDDSDESSDEELTAAQRLALQKKEEAAARRVQRQKDAMAARSKDDLRSPICCILGHVDTGKTKLLDKIRQTNVQEGEAGGITQQIGATYFPADAIEKKTAVLGAKRVEELKLPGLLVIDTPGHESFTNLRTRGSSLCNIAILVVDIMHGLEPQTLESIRLLRDRKTPFIVALNKIDRLFQWEAIPDNSFEDSLAKQKKSVRDEFETRLTQTIVAFAEQGLNAQVHYKNKNFAKYVSLVPTSAHTGEGIPDMLNLLVNLTQTRMSDKLMYITELECTVLEVKVIEGLGTTIDVVLVNGWLHEGDKIVVCGLNGPIVTQVRALLTPQPLRELRVKSQYVHHKSIKAAMGVKISAPDLEKAIAGSRLLVCGPDDDEEDLKEEVMSDLTNLMSTIDRTGHGVWVQASTLGALEALLEFLRTSKIPVAGINIGPVHKKDVVKASVMLEKAREFAVMLCFDVKVEKEAEDMAEELGMKVFKADIIYHLFDRFVEYNESMLEQKRKDQAPSAVFPCVLKMVPGAIFNKKDPLIIGVDVIEGALRIGTPVCVARTNAETKEREIITLGKVTSIEQNHKSLEIVKKGQAGGGVAIKIECAVYETPKTFGRHLEEKDEIYSKISRQSIDVLKESFRKDMTKEDWALVLKLKKVLNVE